MYKIIALIGEAGSGKDAILSRILSKCKNVNKIISYTTRPKREQEIDGINYHYITLEQFKSKKMIETTSFNGWFYGTAYDSLVKNKINIGIFNPYSVQILLDNPNIELYIYYIKASDKNRLLRQLNREDNPNVNEIIRRYSMDNKDFSNLSFNYAILENNDYEDLKNNVTFLIKLINSGKII